MSCTCHAMINPDNEVYNAYQLAFHKIFFRHEFRVNTENETDRDKMWRKKVVDVLSDGADVEWPQKQLNLRGTMKLSTAYLQPQRGVLNDMRSFYLRLRMSKDVSDGKSASQEFLRFLDGLDEDMTEHPLAANPGLRAFCGLDSISTAVSETIACELQSTDGSQSDATAEDVKTLFNTVKNSGQDIQYAIVRPFLDIGIIFLNTNPQISEEKLAVALNSLATKLQCAKAVCKPLDLDPYEFWPTTTPTESSAASPRKSRNAGSPKPLISTMILAAPEDAIHDLSLNTGKTSHTYPLDHLRLITDCAARYRNAAKFAVDATDITEKRENAKGALKWTKIADMFFLLSSLGAHSLEMSEKRAEARNRNDSDIYYTTAEIHMNDAIVEFDMDPTSQGMETQLKMNETTDDVTDRNEEASAGQLSRSESPTYIAEPGRDLEYEEGVHVLAHNADGEPIPGPSNHLESPMHTVEPGRDLEYEEGVHELAYNVNDDDDEDSILIAERVNTTLGEVKADAHRIITAELDLLAQATEMTGIDGFQFIKDMIMDLILTYETDTRSISAIQHRMTIQEHGIKEATCKLINHRLKSFAGYITEAGGNGPRFIMKTIINVVLKHKMNDVIDQPDEIKMAARENVRQIFEALADWNRAMNKNANA